MSVHSKPNIQCTVALLCVNWIALLFVYKICQTRNSHLAYGSYTSVCVKVYNCGWKKTYKSVNKPGTGCILENNLSQNSCHFNSSIKSAPYTLYCITNSLELIAWVEFKIQDLVLSMTTFLTVESHTFDTQHCGVQQEKATFIKD